MVINNTRHLHSVKLQILRFVGHESTTPRQTYLKGDKILKSNNFKLLCIGRNQLNRYFAAAYINEYKRQIILSHRGTKLNSLRDGPAALWTDFLSVYGGIYTGQVSSAMTFANIISHFATKNSCQLFLTGHSLGAWLAQVTCFTTKYLTINDEKKFIAKDSLGWDSVHWYTCVFDSPGAKQFIDIIKDKLFPRNTPHVQRKISTCCLPVEVYQFGANSINTVNVQVGVVFVLTIGKDHLDEKSYFRVIRTHRIQPVIEFVRDQPDQNDESIVKGQAMDWRVGAGNGSSLFER